MKVLKKIISGHFCIFGLVKGHFGLLGPKNGPPSGQTATYRKTKVIQSCLRIWGTYDPIESGPYDPKKWGFRAKKLHFWPEILHFFTLHL